MNIDDHVEDPPAHIATFLDQSPTPCLPAGHSPALQIYYILEKPFVFLGLKYLKSLCVSKF